MIQRYLRHPAVILIGFFLGFLTSCHKSQPSDPFDQLTSRQQAVISYFKEVALGTEFGNASGVIRKWKNEMKIFVGGSPTQELTGELGVIISELNQLTSKSNFSISVTSDSSASNAYVFFGSGDEFARRLPAAENYVQENYGLFFFWWHSNNELYRMASYVDILRADTPSIQKHLLREELTQSLGLAKDSPKFEDSIFQSSFDTRVNKYSDIDKQLIKLLYHPELKPGFDLKQTEEKLIEIIPEVVPG